MLKSCQVPSDIAMLWVGEYKDQHDIAFSLVPWERLNAEKNKCIAEDNISYNIGRKGCEATERRDLFLPEDM